MHGILSGWLRHQRLYFTANGPLIKYPRMRTHVRVVTQMVTPHCGMIERGRVPGTRQQQNHRSVSEEEALYCWRSTSNAV